VRLSLSVIDNLAGGFVALSSIDSDAALEAKAEFLTCVCTMCITLSTMTRAIHGTESWESGNDVNRSHVDFVKFSSSSEVS
jgi:hypothetical protein